jgi:steroid delta-isomerase-like uncharacterized protein
MREVKMKKRSVIFATILIFIVSSLSCGPGVDEQAAKNKAIVMQAFDALNNHDYEKLDELIAENYVRHSQATPDIKVESLDDFKALVGDWSQAFPDAKMEIHLVVAEGDLVAFYMTYTGTHTGQMGPFPATGNVMNSETTGFHRLEEGKIVETWVTWDNVAILNQLGLFPSPPAGE